MKIVEEKFAEIDELFKRIHDYNRSHTSYKVDIDACFNKVYHLKDFLQREPSVVTVLQNYTSNVKQYVEDYINNNHYLQICGAINNRIKHYENRNKSRADAKIEHINVSHRFSFGEDGITLNPGEGAIVQSFPKAYYTKTSNPNNKVAYEYKKELQEYIIKDDSGNSHKAVELLYYCIQAWVNFLTKHNLMN